MSMPSLNNNIMQQPQNIVINQVNQVQPITHTIMTNVPGPVNNGIPIATAMTNQVHTMDHQPNEMKPNTIVMDTMPMPGTSLVNVQTSHQQPAIQASVPMTAQNSTPTKNLHATNTNNASSSNAQSSPDSVQLLSKTRMTDLIRDIDPNIYMEEEVEEILLGYVDDFVDRVINGASLIAKHRHVKSIEVKDVQMFINRNYNMWAPGLGTDELRPYKRSLTTESHKQRLALIRKALKKY